MVRREGPGLIQHFYSQTHPARRPRQPMRAGQGDGLDAERQQACTRPAAPASASASVSPTHTAHPHPLHTAHARDRPSTRQDLCHPDLSPPNASLPHHLSRLARSFALSLLCRRPPLLPAPSSRLPTKFVLCVHPSAPPFPLCTVRQTQTGPCPVDTTNRPRLFLPSHINTDPPFRPPRSPLFAANPAHH